MTGKSKRWARLVGAVLVPTALQVSAGCTLPKCLNAPPVCPPPPPPLHCVPVPESCEETPPPVRPDGSLTSIGERQPIDLPTALQLADRQSPQIAVARERVREAYAWQRRAELFWVPNLELGPTWTRHDGPIQRATGEVPTVSRSALWVGATAALTVDTGDALFLPLAAQQVTEAARAGAEATRNARLLDVSLAYTDLLQAYGELSINDETLRNARELLTITERFQKEGKGVAADTARARTEVRIREREQLEIEGRIGVITARLAELLYLPGAVGLKPVEPALAPLALVPEEASLDGLLVSAVTYRPELAENRALAEAALSRWRAAKIGPWVPNLRLSYAAGGFGGGANSDFRNFDGRHDVAVSAYWQLDNLGFGDRAAIVARRSQYTQTALRQQALQAEVANQVVSAFRLAFVRRSEIEIARSAVEAALESYRLNLDRVRRAPDQGRPIELLQAVQALARARQDALQTIADYNRSQFRLYTAIGNPPLCALGQLSCAPESPAESGTQP